MPAYLRSVVDRPAVRVLERRCWEEKMLATPRSLSIIIVEDEPITRMVVLDALEELGHEALEADAGLVALEILRTESHIDLLITDLHLPGMNGFQIASSARELRPDLKIIYMTGADDSEIPASELGAATSVLAKPFSIDHLIAAIDSFFRPTAEGHR